MSRQAPPGRAAVVPDADEATASRDEAHIRPVTSDAGDHRREHHRYAVDLDVSVGSDHNFYAGFAENLSAGGVFIATHKLKPVGATVELTINLAESGVVKGVGEVRWVRVYNEHSDSPPGMGVRFLELEAGSTEAITRFLEHREPLFFDEE